MTSEAADNFERSLLNLDRSLESLIQRSERIIRQIAMGQSESTDMDTTSSASVQTNSSNASSNMSLDESGGAALDSNTDSDANSESDNSQSTIIDGEPSFVTPQLYIPPTATEQIPTSPAAVPPLNASNADEVILLDDTQIDNAAVNNSQSDDLVYVQTIHNPDPPIIDLCDVVEDHSYSRPEDIRPTRRRRRENTADLERTRSRSPITVEHSYAGAGEQIPIITFDLLTPQVPAREMPPPPPAVVTSPVRNSQLSQSLNNSISQFGTCSICLDSYLRRQPHSTVCGHVFCKSCILSAIQATKSCPLCRKKINAKSIHPLHL